MTEEDDLARLYTLADRMRWARQQKGVESQAKLARMAGVSIGAIGNYESGKRHNPRQLLQIAGALGCNAGWLQSGTGTPFDGGAPERALTAHSRRIAELLDDIGPPDSPAYMRAYMAVRVAIDDATADVPQSGAAGRSHRRPAG